MTDSIEPLLVWRDDYLIGVEELDYEHRDLVYRMNELHEELVQHREKEEIEKCLGEIHARMAVHFALEEHFMLENDFDGYAGHKQEHDEFLEEIVEVIEKFQSRPDLDYAAEFARLLQHWIHNHILTSDQELAKAKKGK